MLEQINRLRVLVKQELEILKLCVTVGEDSTMLPHIQLNKQQLESEVKQIDQIMNKFQQKQLLSDNDRDKLDFIKLTISKILLQNEKIYNSEAQFRNVLTKVPRIQDDDSLQQQFTLGAPNATKSKDSSFQTKNTLKILPNKEQNQQDQQYKFVRSNIDTLIKELQDLSLKVDTHKHNDYQLQIDRINEENAKLRADCNLLKQDNTELFHINNEISQSIKQIENDNEQLFQQFGMFKEQGRQSSMQQSYVSNYYIPFDESKAQLAEQIMSKLQQY